MLERVTRQIEAELRRRLGGPFTSEELADLYDAGTGWCSDLAYAAAPEQPVRLGRPRRGRRRLRALPARGDGLRRRPPHDLTPQLRRAYAGGLRVNVRYTSTVSNPSRS